MTYRLLVALLAIAQALIVNPARSDQTLWYQGTLDFTFYPSIVQACQTSSAFGPTPWTGLITSISDYRPLDFECSWSNPFGGGP